MILKQIIKLRPLRFGLALWLCDHLHHFCFKYTKTTENSNIICGGRIVLSCGLSYLRKDLFSWPTELWIMNSIQSKGFTKISVVFYGLFCSSDRYWIPIMDYGLTLKHGRLLPSDRCPTFTVYLSGSLSLFTLWNLMTAGNLLLRMCLVSFG